MIRIGDMIYTDIDIKSNGIIIKAGQTGKVVDIINVANCSEVRYVIRIGYITLALSEMYLKLVKNATKRRNLIECNSIG